MMKQILKAKKFFVLFILFGIFIVASSAFALELEWPPSPTGDVILKDDTTLPEMVQYFYEWGITIGGLATFIALVTAGFQYLTSAGSPAKMTDAKDRISSAVLGLFLLLVSFLILDTINPEFTALKMPSDISEPSGSLEEEQFGFFIKSCEEAVLWDQTDYTGNDTLIRPEYGCVSEGLSIYSVEFEGSCTLYLYPKANCGGDPEGILVLASDTPDILGRYGETDFGSAAMQLGAEEQEPIKTCWNACNDPFTGVCGLGGAEYHICDDFCMFLEISAPEGDEWCLENWGETSCCCYCHGM